MKVLSYSLSFTVATALTALPQLLRAESGAVAGTSAVAETAGASSGDDAAALARKLQNPLASIRSLMTDNAIGFNTGQDQGTSYSFQLQPVYAIDFPDQGLTLIPRGILPVMGLESGSKSLWGLGDMMLQLFVAPHVKSKWKWGLGPQVSLATHTDGDLAGPRWGAGPVGVITGDITPQLNMAALVDNHWGFDGKFNTLMIQPILFYNLKALPGAYFGYNAMISADWKARSSDRWTVPLGLSVGKTFSLGGGHGLDIMAGPYYNVVRPDGAADWSIRFGINWVLP